MRESDPHQPNESVELEVEKTNPAKRLHSLISLALTQNTGIAALEAWAITFGIEPGAANENPHQITDKLRLMNGEVENLRRLMQKTHFSADLYEATLASVLRLLSVANLSAGWNSIVGAVSAENLLALRWCSEAIESEVGLTHAELQGLLDDINAFKEDVESADLPDAVREFVLQQIELMIQGIHQYPIIGRRAAREAVRRAAAEVFDADDSVANAAPTSYKEKIAKLWTTMLASVEGSEKMVKAITGVAEAVPKLIAAVSGGSSTP
jgi:hypothetical protein